MIARDSKSYPYLAIAQHYGVDYGEVLRYSEAMTGLDPFDHHAWHWAVYDLEMEKKHAKQN